MKMFLKSLGDVLLGGFVAAILSVSAIAQSNPGLTYKQVPTAGQWNGYFSAKQDVLGYVPFNSAGGVLTGRLVTAPPSSTTAGFNLTPGSTPASPVNGDLWITSAGVFARVNGSTIGPLGGASSSSFAATAPLSVTFPSGVTTYACTTCGVTTSPLSQFSSTTSAQLAGIVSDETGSGPLVFGTSPTLSGLTVTGSFTATGLVTNASLANPSLTLGSTSLTLGSTTTTVAGLSLTSPTITGGTVNALTGFSLRDTSAAFNVTLAATSSPILTAARTVTFNVNNISPNISLNGNLTFANAFTTAGNFAVTQTYTAATNVTFPTTGTLATLAGSEAFTNKTYNGNAWTAGTGTLTLAAGKTLTANNSIILAGTDGKTLTTSNSITLAGTDGTVWTGPSANASLAALNIAGQTITGGAVVTPNSLSTGSFTLDCGLRPLQSITNGGAFTITAPANDGYCVVKVTNNATAGTITFTGFSVGSNTGAALNTTNGNKFFIQVQRVGGDSTYSVVALQ